MVVCERPGFWRWTVRVSIDAIRALPRELVGAIRAVPEVFRMISKLRIKEELRNPVYEFTLGIMTLWTLPMILGLTPDLTLGTKIVLVLLIVPSFLVMMHGIYRKWGDC